MRLPSVAVFWFIIVSLDQRRFGWLWSHSRAIEPRSALDVTRPIVIPRRSSNERCQSIVSFHFTSIWRSSLAVRKSLHYAEGTRTNVILRTSTKFRQMLCPLHSATRRLLFYSASTKVGHPAVKHSTTQGPREWLRCLSSSTSGGPALYYSRSRCYSVHINRHDGGSSRSQLRPPASRGTRYPGQR